MQKGSDDDDDDEEGSCLCCSKDQMQKDLVVTQHQMEKGSWKDQLVLQQQMQKGDSSRAAASDEELILEGSQLCCSIIR